MLFKYRSTLVHRETGKAVNTSYTIDTELWFERLADPKHQHMYHNSKQMIEVDLLPRANDADVEIFCALLHNCYNAWKVVNQPLIFELAMYFWAQYKKGLISSKVWAAVLAVAWQAGRRGMLACVALNANQVREMFKAADLETLHYLSSGDENDLVAAYAALPDEIAVYRGVSTGIEHHLDGFSWTTDPAEAAAFLMRNCHNDREIPGICQAIVKKESVLALFDFENEVVVDPAVPKVEADVSFFKGKDLRDFRKQHRRLCS